MITNPAEVGADAPFLPFALPDLDQAELHAVQECLRSGWITSR